MKNVRFCFALRGVEDEDEDEMRLGYFFSDGFLEIWFWL